MYEWYKRFCLKKSLNSIEFVELVAVNGLFNIIDNNKISKWGLSSAELDVFLVLV